VRDDRLSGTDLAGDKANEAWGFELDQLGLLFGGSYVVREENRNFIDCHYVRLREVETLELALGDEGVLLHN
jgi:hypothetical protein